MPKGRLAIIAGGGELPHIGMAEALASGEDAVFLASSNPISSRENILIGLFQFILLRSVRY